MKKKALLILALVAVFLFAAVGCTPPGGHEGESEPLLNSGETIGQSETTPTETTPEDFGASGVEIWEDEEPTGNQNGNSGSGSNDQGSQGGNQGQTGSNQSGNQGQTGGNESGGETTPDATEPQQPDEPDEPDQPQQPTDPESGAEPTVPAEPDEVTYEDYAAMTPEQQQAFFESFPSVEAFMDWYNAAKAEYEENKEGIVIEGGNIDIGDYIEKP